MIEFEKEQKQKMIESIRRYFLDELDEEIGDLKATLLLEFFIQEIGPSVYNRAITDATAHMRERVADMEGSCFEAEFAYWKEKKKNRR